MLGPEDLDYIVASLIYSDEGSSARATSSTQPPTTPGRGVGEEPADAGEADQGPDEQGAVPRPAHGLEDQGLRTGVAGPGRHDRALQRQRDARQPGPAAQAGRRGHQEVPVHRLPQHRPPVRLLEVQAADPHHRLRRSAVQDADVPVRRRSGDRVRGGLGRAPQDGREDRAGERGQRGSARAVHRRPVDLPRGDRRPVPVQPGRDAAGPGHPLHDQPAAVRQEGLLAGGPVSGATSSARTPSRPGTAPSRRSARTSPSAPSS